MAIDIVKPLKIENPATGGTQTDPYPREVDPSQDYLSGAGVAFQGLSTRTIDLDGSGNIQFKDVTQTAAVTVTQLKTAVNNTFNNSTNGFTATNVQTAIEEVRNILTSPSTDQNYYVTKFGNDTSGNGSIGKPYLTIGKALTVIIDSSVTKRYVINVGPGDYNENLVLKANVFIKGSNPITTRITGTTLNINDATWNTATTDNRSGFQDITINPVCTWDFTAQTNNTDGKLYFFNIRTGAAWTTTAKGAVNQLIIQDSEVFGTTTFNGMNTYVHATSWQSGDLVLNSSAAASIPAILTVISGRIAGNITATWTSNAAVTLNLAGLTVSSSTILTASGASCTVNVNDGSLPVPANRSFVSSSILVRLNDNFAKGLLSATTNVDVSAATAPTVGQLLTATSSTVATWQNPITATNYEAIATASATITTTDALLTSMTATPIAGIYLVIFSSDFNSANSGIVITLDCKVGGSAVADMQRKFMPFAGGTLTAGSQRVFAGTNGIVTVNGSQAIEIFCSTSSGTVTSAARNLSIVRIA